MNERAPAPKKTMLISPSPANRKLWGKIKPLIGSNCPQIWLPSDREKRVRILDAIGETNDYILIGGSGREHDESYFFTRGSGMSLKINIDAHPDEYISDDDGGDLVNVNGKLTYVLDCRDRISCSNHMSFTKREGTPIYTVDAVTGSFLNFFQDSMERFLRKAQMKAEMEKGKVAITIDVDGIRGMPVLGQYESGQTTSAQRVLDFVEANTGKVGALDVFGLVEDIPDFDLNTEANLAKPPSLREMRLFREAAGGAGINQQTLDKVGSYMAMFYAKLAGLFLD